MDIATIIGLAAGGIAIAQGILLIGLNPLELVSFTSVLITVGGCFAATIVSGSFSRLKNSVKFTRSIFVANNFDNTSIVLLLINFSEQSRRQGLLSLEDNLGTVDNEFLQKGIQLVVDGVDPELIRSILESEINGIEEQHEEGIGFWNHMGAYFPAFGMIGTIVGLIAMLRVLDTGNINVLGQGMALALLTTFYGILGANFIAYPIAAKLRMKRDHEIKSYMIMLEGILSIQTGISPRVLRDQLISFLQEKEKKVILTTQL